MTVDRVLVSHTASPEDIVYRRYDENLQSHGLGSKYAHGAFSSLSYRRPTRRSVDSVPNCTKKVGNATKDTVGELKTPWRGCGAEKKKQKLRKKSDGSIVDVAHKQYTLANERARLSICSVLVVCSFRECASGSWAHGGLNMRSEQCDQINACSETARYSLLSQ